MGVLSLGNAVVWQANSRMIRLLLTHLDPSEETAQYLDWATANFHLVRHFPLDEATPNALAEIRKAAAIGAETADNQSVTATFRELMSLIDGLPANRTGQPQHAP